MIQIPITQNSDAADLPLPQYMSDGASGLDLYSANHDDIVMKPGEIHIISTGISVAIPHGYEIQVRPRSGLAFKHGISIVNSPGTIDSDYRGEIRVVLVNLGKVVFTIKRGYRIVQMILHKVESVKWMPVKDLEYSVRAEGGFGHTGL